MVTTNAQLAINRCPHCNTANPTLARAHHLNAQPQKLALVPMSPGEWIQWHIYICGSCAGLVAAAVALPQSLISQVVARDAAWLVPKVGPISTDIPARAASYLNQARETLASPSASVVMSASAVDAMLKERGYKEGSLYSRIKMAEDAGVLTTHMAEWAHDIRLDANDERHADFDASAAKGDDARRCLEFAEALADLLFVLPARVKRGRKPPPTAP